MHITKASALLMSVLSIAAYVGCDKKPTTTSNNTPPAKADSHVHDDGTVHTDNETPSNSNSHVHEDGTVHTDDAHASEHAGHGKPLELGTATAGGFSLRAARDEGAIKPGGDAAIDVWVTGGTAKVVNVRFWIGTQDAKGSIKAKAEIEFPTEPNHWHTHVEVPSPLPAGSKLWVEVEDDKGARSMTSFDLKA